MEQLKIQPILLGGDINCYSVARAFHEAYGVTSIAIGRYPMGATNDSKIVKCTYLPDFDTEAVFLPTLEKVAAHFEGKGTKLILMGCTDHYASLIMEYKDALSPKFITPYIDAQLRDRLIQKETFYTLCDEMGIDHPDTVIFRKGQTDVVIPFRYPVIVKPSDSISYWMHPFDGMKKVYTANSKEEVLTICETIYKSGYSESMIIQDMVPGDDSFMRVLTCYSDRCGKVKMMCLGHVLLEEHTPTAVGNHAAIVTEYNEALFTKIKGFLEKLGYVGYSNFDIKYDVRDGKYKAFEINLRQGRSNYYVTGCGQNVAKLVVEDYVLEEELPFVEQKEPYYWHVIPNGVVFKYVKDEKVKTLVKKLIKDGQECNSLEYSFDLKGNLKRRFWFEAYTLNHYKKYKKYYK